MDAGFSMSALDDMAARNAHIAYFCSSNVNRTKSIDDPTRQSANASIPYPLEEFFQVTDYDQPGHVTKGTGISLKFLRHSSTDDDVQLSPNKLRFQIPLPRNEPE